MAMLKASIPFEVDVENHNGPAGCYSVLGFVSSDHPEAPRNRKLFDYARVNVETSSVERATVALSADTISLVEADGTKKIFPGTYIVTVGTSNYALKLTGSAVLVDPPPP